MVSHDQDFLNNVCTDIIHLGTYTEGFVGTVMVRDGSSTLVIVLEAALSIFLKCVIVLLSTEVFVASILTTVHAITKSFVPFCSAQDGESTDMNCLVFWAHCKNGKILTKCQVYNKEIYTSLGIFS